MPNSSNHQKFLVNNFLVKILVLITLIVSFSLGLILPNQFKIKQIKYQPQNNVLNGVEELKGQNLLFLETSTTIKTLRANNPEIEQLNLTKIYPNSLKISFVKSKPIAQIKTNNHYILLNSKGRIIRQQKEPEPKLLTINYYQSIRAFEAKEGQTIINQDLLYTVQLITEAIKQGFNLETITVTKPGQIVARLKAKKTVVTFSSKKNIAKNWRIVHNILGSLKMKGQSPKEINLLFDKPYFIL